MSKYNDLLAAWVLNDERIVTYRLLSREMNVHVNVAKQMMFAFHESANKIHPNSCHATYIISGTKQVPLDQTAETQSSFEASQSSVTGSGRSPILIKTIMLVQEESLHDIIATFEQVTTVHVYSLEPNAFNDMAMLATVDVPSTDDPQSLEHFGVAVNPDARKTAITPANAMPAESQTGLSKGASPATLPKKAGMVPSKTQGAAAPADIKKEIQKPTPVKRENSIAKTLAGMPARKPIEKKKESVIQSVEPSLPSPMEMDEEEDSQSKTRISAAQEARQMEELRQSMLDDEGMCNGNYLLTTDVKMPDATATEEENNIDWSPSREPHQEHENAAAEPKRKRGRRRVTKKVHTKDVDGYIKSTLVPGWESFSEEEPDEAQAESTQAVGMEDGANSKATNSPSKDASMGAPKTTSSLPHKTSKPPSGKVGPKEQRSIMSFFGKR